MIFILACLQLNYESKIAKNKILITHKKIASKKINK